MNAPQLPVYANATAAPYGSQGDDNRDLLANQIASSVRFVEQIEAMHAAGARVFVEVGPGSVLTGLVGRILEGREHAPSRSTVRARQGSRAGTTASPAWSQPACR